MPQQKSQGNSNPPFDAIFENLSRYLEMGGMSKEDVLGNLTSLNEMLADRDSEKETVGKLTAFAKDLQGTAVVAALAYDSLAKIGINESSDGLVEAYKNRDKLPAEAVSNFVDKVVKGKPGNASLRSALQNRIDTMSVEIDPSNRSFTDTVNKGGQQSLGGSGYGGR